jgi:hypothetical protein
MGRATAKKPTSKIKRKFDALPDTVDFRDQMFVPTLVEVPPVSNLDAYRALKLTVLDQGEEGACTGFGLAAVANYLLRRLYPDENKQVSPHMLYVMARRYDEWPDENYEGSSARGAMKGWHKHGVCSDTAWPDSRHDLSMERALDAIKRPLGAYFRVNPKNLVAMHAAIAEVGILYATAEAHRGWDQDRVGKNGIISFSKDDPGGHAFAIVGYDAQGFWIQNSWGPGWGKDGLGRISYDDWLINGTDVWVARLGAPVVFTGIGTSAKMRASAPRSQETHVYADLRNHIITLENDGRLRSKGMFGLTEEALEEMILKDVPTDMKAKGCKRLMIYAHGGLVSEDYAIQYVADHRQKFLAAGIYPLCFVWRSDALTTISNILQDAFGKRWAGGPLESLKEFMLDRLDDTMEPIARKFGGKALWDEMKENAELASASPKGGARKAAEFIKKLTPNEIGDIHLAGHSAGAVFHAHFSSLLTSTALGRSVQVKSLSLWAPACTTDLFHKKLMPQITNSLIEAFDLYTLDDKKEQDDDCKNIYHKSLLYLVSNAFEERPRKPGAQDGWPILGMEKFVKLDKDLTDLFTKSDPKKYRWFKAPKEGVTKAEHHGDFDNDGPTLSTTIQRIAGTKRLFAKELPDPARQARFSETVSALQSNTRPNRFR